MDRRHEFFETEVENNTWVLSNLIFIVVKLNRLVLEDYSELEARIKTRDSGDTVQQACKTVLQSSPCAKSYLEKPLSSLFFPATVQA